MPENKIWNDLFKAYIDQLLYGTGYMKHVPVRNISKDIAPMKTTKPKKMTKDQHIEELKRQKDEFAQSLRDKTSEAYRIAELLRAREAELDLARQTIRRLTKTISRWR